MGLLSPVEHAKSLRPSPLLNVFLLTTVLLDGARARTECLISTSNVIPSVFLASLAVKITLLVLEAYPKGHHANHAYPPEASSGIFSLSLFSWLNPLIYQGNRGNLTSDELSPLDAPLAAETVVTHFQSVWESSKSAFERSEKKSKGRVTDEGGGQAQKINTTPSLGRQRKPCGFLSS